LLQSTGVLGFPCEWLRGDGGKASDQYVSYPTDLEEQVLVMFRDGVSPNGVCALKMFPEHFDSTSGGRWAERIPGLKFVHLIRRDVLGQAISLSIARQTESYAHWMPEQRPAAYSRDHIQRCMDWLLAGDARWRLFFASNGIAPLVVIYEDLCVDAQGVVSAIAEHVGVVEAKIGVRSLEPRVQRDARNREWRERFVAESGDLGVLPRARVVTFAEHLWRPQDAPAAELGWLRLPIVAHAGLTGR
jgi:LPS sulfotransferase NodH